MSDCFIGIDTSNYTTSCAACDEEGKVFANIRIPLPVAEGERGLRQSDAVFAHVLAFQTDLRLCGQDLSHVLKHVGYDALRVLLDQLRLPEDLAAAGRGTVLKSDVHSISPLLASAL